MIYNTHYTKRCNGESCSSSFRDLAEFVEDAVRDLKPFLDDFDAIVVTGVSGLSVGAPLAIRLNKALAVVRKKTEGCHSQWGGIEGKADLIGQRVIFVDDFSCTGATLRTMTETLDRAEAFDRSLGEHGDYGPLRYTLVGTYMYGRGEVSIQRKREEVK